MEISIVAFLLICGLTIGLQQGQKYTGVKLFTLTSLMTISRTFIANVYKRFYYEKNALINVFIYFSTFITSMLVSTQDRFCVLRSIFI